MPTVLALALALAVAAPAPSRTLSVAAAANVKSAVEEMAAAFESRTPGVRVAVTLGASGTFFAQIEQGAPFDLFLSADREYPRRLVEAGMARAEDEAVYAVGTLVVWAPPGSRLDLAGRGLAALADPAVRRVAVANPAIAPYGRAAEAALRAAGLWEAVSPKLVLGENVSQAAQFAETGAAEAALLPRSLTLAPALRGGRILEVAGPRARLEQSAVVLRGGRSPDLARAFLAFVRGDDGRAILAKWGYALP